MVYYITRITDFKAIGKCHICDAILCIYMFEIHALKCHLLTHAKMYTALFIY